MSRTKARDVEPLERRRPPPFAHLLVATDGSSGAARALVRAAWLPLAARGKISVLQVVPTAVPHRIHRDVRARASRQLDVASKTLRSAIADAGRRDLTVRAELCEGQPYVEIIRRARTLGADLIVLGRHGERPIRDMFLGSTAERVVRSAELPVLVVRRRATRRYARALVAVDLEDTFRSVVTVAVRALGPEVTTLGMVHAYHVPFEGFSTPGVSPTQTTALRTAYRKDSVAALARMQAAVAELGVRWETAVVRGEPRTVILDEAEHRRAELLTLGTHGRTGVAHALIGSVAEWVIRGAACDVLVARPARVSFELP